MVFAQIVTSPAPGSTLSVIELAVNGGFMMIPIVISSFVAVYIFVERVLTINKANQNPDAFIGRIKEMGQDCSVVSLTVPLHG